MSDSMTDQKQYFFCGIGGSGMLPLAMILRGQGAEVSGSDRALDQGRTPEKFEWLRGQGIGLFPQDGSGLVSGDQVLVASAAIEDTVPDVAAAIEQGCRRVSRAELLSELFNDAALSVGVAGTSGKSTTTAMIAWILHATGADPTVMNGAVMKNFAGPGVPFASALVGKGDAFVSEVDESDGSIAMYSPDVALLNNVSLDHKSMDELRALFGNYLAKAGTAILNADDSEVLGLAQRAQKARTYSFERRDADLYAHSIKTEPTSISCVITADGNEAFRLSLKVPGRHNLANAMAALLACEACGIELKASAAAMADYAGIRRRFDIVGTADGVTIIDDFAHNPDKIAATLKTLRDFPGRLLVLFQPHGFGPLKKMRSELASAFIDNMLAEDVLVMPEPVYFGGTVDRAVSSEDLVADIQTAGVQAERFETREACGERLLALARSGDRIIVMGARDDTLSEFAARLLQEIQQRS
ncbi:MAG: Mur ligase family protein [Pseudomonadota bacterium]